YNTVTTPVDFGAKSVMQLGALVTLWRLQAVGIKYFSKPPDRQEIATNSAIAGTTATSKRVHRGLSIYLACSVLWGVGLFGSLLQALWIRQPCPPTCQAALMNLWDSTCQCMFVHVNCVQTNSQDVDSALQTSQLGVKLYAIQVSQCDLVDGIANATLHQFPALSYVSIQFTKTKAWDGQLPNSISFFTASDNRFTALPAILQQELPLSLVSLSFSHQPMATSPVIPQSWKVLSRLEMTNVNLSAFVNFTGFSLVTLRIANNNLTQWPPSIMAMPSLLELDISGNALQILPWKLESVGTFPSLSKVAIGVVSARLCARNAFHTWLAITFAISLVSTQLVATTLAIAKPLHSLEVLKPDARRPLAASMALEIVPSDTIITAKNAPLGWKIHRICSFPKDGGLAYL
ncbi:unnamed protein product, partial [Aphanomyces euteiches]